MVLRLFRRQVQGWNDGLLKSQFSLWRERIFCLKDRVGQNSSSPRLYMNPLLPGAELLLGAAGG